jgi:hypothetical protein
MACRHYLVCASATRKHWNPIPPPARFRSVTDTPLKKCLSLITHKVANDFPTLMRRLVSLFSFRRGLGPL